MRGSSVSRGLGMAVGLFFGAALAGGAPAEGPPNDDLAVVKRAVQADSGAVAEASPASAIRLKPSGEKTRASRRPAQWLKVRVVERGGKGTRVTVNLPLAAARALGDDFPIEIGDGKIRLSEILRSLEAGEPLVEVKDVDTTVRVWVE